MLAEDRSACSSHPYPAYTVKQAKEHCHSKHPVQAGRYRNKAAVVMGRCHSNLVAEDTALVAVVVGREMRCHSNPVAVRLGTGSSRGCRWPCHHTPAVPPRCVPYWLPLPVGAGPSARTVGGRPGGQGYQGHYPGSRRSAGTPRTEPDVSSSFCAKL